MSSKNPLDHYFFLTNRLPPRKLHLHFRFYNRRCRKPTNFIPSLQSQQNFCLFPSHGVENEDDNCMGPIPNGGSPHAQED